MDDFLRIFWADNKVHHLQILPSCIDYFEMEKDHEKQMQLKSKINISNNRGNMNIIAGDVSNATQSLHIGSTESEISTLLCEMKKLIKALDISSEAKDEISDDLESLSEQIESSEPKIPRIKKAMESIKAFLETSANATTLAANYYVLAPLIARLIQEIGVRIQ